MSATMRAKMVITEIAKGVTYEKLTLVAVGKKEGYQEDGTDENNTFSKFTPAALLEMMITNPSLLNEFKVGEELYLDFTKEQNQLAIDHSSEVDRMVNKFLSWQLPKDFSPDGRIDFNKSPDFLGNEITWPIGTNLFNYAQAKKMIEYLLS